MGRRNDTGTPSPGQPGRLATLSRKGRGGLDSCLRRKDTGTPSPGQPGRLATLSRKGRGGLGSCLRGNDTCWISACAGMTRWPPHPAVPWATPASPAVGRGVLDCCLRRKDTCSCLRRNDTSGHADGQWAASLRSRLKRPLSQVDRWAACPTPQ